MRRGGVIVLVGLIFAGCGSATGLPELDSTSVQQGRVLYQQHCASCHGADLAGAPNWRTRNEDGTYPPPPQDSSGHTWHHSDELLLSIVRDGWDDPLSAMPAFGDSLTDEEIVAILDFFKSEWGHEERAFQWRVTNDVAG